MTRFSPRAEHTAAKEDVPERPSGTLGWCKPRRSRSGTTGLEELALVEASGWRKWPTRLPEQQILYPGLD